MAVHTKTRYRLKLLLLLAASIGLFGALGYVLRQRQIEARALEDRKTGYAALEAKDYYTALHKIGPFLQRNPDDTEALFKYAVARTHVEEPNGKHLSDAMFRYRRLLDRDPDHQQARENLLELYVSVGFTSEILSATEGRVDSASRRARAIALAALSRHKEAIQLLDGYCADVPGDVRMQLFRAMQMQRDGRAHDELLSHARQLQSSHLDDPVFEVLLAFTHLLADQRAEALEWARRAAARPLADQHLVGTTVELLDSLDQYPEALAVLERASDVMGDSIFKRRVAARLFQSGRFEDVALRFAELERNAAGVDANLLAHRALALGSMKRFDEAKRTIELLRARRGDLVAAAWAGVLEAVPREGEMPDDRRIILACREGLKSDAQNPYFRLYLGDAYGRLGELEEATRQWIIAARAAPIWPQPLTRLVRAVIATGATQDLAALGTRLEALAPDDPEILATAAASLLQASATPDAPELGRARQLVDRILERDPAQPAALLLKVRTLERAGQASEARTFIQAAIDSDQPMPVGSYLALADAAQAVHPELVAAFFDRCQAVHGADLRLARARAAWLIRSGRAPQGLETFERMMQESGGTTTLEWRLAWGGLLDLARDGRARGIWIQVVREWPDSAMVHRYIVASPSTQEDRPLVRESIRQLNELVGEDGVAWRVAEARWILQGDAKQSIARERETARAATLLNPVILRYPNQLEARLLLIDCLRRLGKSSETIEHLTVASRLAPGLVQLRLQLAVALQGAGRFDEAKPQIEESERLLHSAARNRQAAAPGGQPLDSGMNPASAWRTLAALHAAEGSTEDAARLLRAADDLSPLEVDLAIAQIMARRGSLSDEDCARLLETPSLRSIEAVAENYRRNDRLGDAEAALALLDHVDASPGERELLRGLHYQRRGDLNKAVEQFRIACARMPNSTSAWRSLISSSLLLGDGEQAISAATQAAGHLPGEPRYSMLLESAGLIRGQAGYAPVRPLLAALVDPESDFSVAVKALETTQTAARTEQSVEQTAAVLRPLADRAPSLAALQYLLVDLYLQVGRADDAVVILMRLGQLRPADPLPLRRAAEVLVAAQRWNQALSAAEQWRVREGNNTVQPDRLLASVYLARGEFAKAERQLAPHMGRPRSDISVTDRLTSTYAISLAGLGRVAEAQSLLEPGLSRSPESREAWIRVVQLIQDVPLVERMLERVRAEIPPAAAAEHLRLAGTWFRLYDRTKDEAHLQATKNQLDVTFKSLDAAAPQAAELWLALGSYQEQCGNRSEAEFAYRRALQIDPDLLVAANNLSMVILHRRGDLDEALRLATRAADGAADVVRPEFLDTLAQVQYGIGNQSAAETTLKEAIALAPNNLPIRANLVQILLEQGKHPEAQRVFRELEQRFRTAKDRPDALAVRIGALQAALASGVQTQ